MPLIKEAHPLEERPAFWGKKSDQTAVRKGSWKLIQDEDTVELYHLDEDLGETKDLSEHESERVTGLLEEIKAWQKDVSTGVVAL